MFKTSKVTAILQLTSPRAQAFATANRPRKLAVATGDFRAAACTSLSRSSGPRPGAGNALRLKGKQSRDVDPAAALCYIFWERLKIQED
jgi:hypothetical protein